MIHVRNKHLIESDWDITHANIQHISREIVNLVQYRKPIKNDHGQCKKYVC